MSERIGKKYSRREIFIKGRDALVNSAYAAGAVGATVGGPTLAVGLGEKLDAQNLSRQDLQPTYSNIYIRDAIQPTPTSTGRKNRMDQLRAQKLEEEASWKLNLSIIAWLAATPATVLALIDLAMEKGVFKTKQ